MWDNTDLIGPCLNGMRNSMNVQIWSFKEPNFLCVPGTHGSANLALFDQYIWDRYQFARFAGGNISRNTFILAAPGSLHDPVEFRSAEGAFSSKHNSVEVLQQHGVVFLACHNTIWELAEQLVRAEQNPDHLNIDGIAAELTNHLIPDVVLTRRVVATLVQLRQSKLVYSKCNDSWPSSEIKCNTCRFDLLELVRLASGDDCFRSEISTMMRN